jgi:hypothetical protein
MVPMQVNIEGIIINLLSFSKVFLIPFFWFLPGCDLAKLNPACRPQSMVSRQETWPDFLSQDSLGSVQW